MAGSDIEKFVREVFVQAAEFDPLFLAEQLTVYHLKESTYGLNLNVGYREQQQWNDRSVEEVLDAYPALDYRRLSSDQFRNTDEGRKLLQVYTEMCGKIKARLNQKGRLERTITVEGQIKPRPMIPLTKHPIIEALVATEFQLDRPRAKYDFGPSDIIELVIDSDSARVHQALVQSVTSRLPEEFRNVFDGPSEFQHKRNTIQLLLYAYQEAWNDEQRRALLRDDFLAVHAAYTTEGEIVQTLWVENEAYRESSKRWSSSGKPSDSPEFNQLRTITHDLIRVGLIAPDPEIVAITEKLIESSLGITVHGDEKLPSVALSQAELKLIVIDALGQVSAASNTEALRWAASVAFGDELTGDRLQALADMKYQAEAILNSPAVQLAYRAVRKFVYSLSDEEKSEEQIEAKAGLSRAREPVENLENQKRRQLNQFLLEQLRDLVRQNGQEGDATDPRLFSGFVSRLKFNAYHMTALPSEYHELVTLAKDQAVSLDQRSTIAWHIYEQFQYIDSSAQHLMLEVLPELFEVLLGPVDAVPIPEAGVDHALAAVTQIVHKHGKRIFQSATQQQLETLGQYEVQLRMHAERVAAGGLINEPEAEGLSQSLGEVGEWQKDTLRVLEGVIREIQTIGTYYAEYLHIEAVKVSPHIYYPWMLEQLEPLFRKLGWEVAPGNRPSRAIVELNQVLENIVKHSLVIKPADEYDEDFDPIEEGHLDTLLLEGYSRMVVPHDIQYNGTVWREGLGFMYLAVAFMPPALLERIIAKYPNTKFGEYLRNVHDRWNKDSDG